MRPTKILLVGCGFMGTSLLKGWYGSAYPVEVHIVTPHPESIQFEAHFYKSPQNLPIDFSCDVIVFAILPSLFESVLPLYGGLIGHNSSLFVISIAAGKKTETIQKMIRVPVPIVRVMPNLPVSEGKGTSVGFMSGPLREDQKILTEHLFKGVGWFEWIKQESEFDAITALSGSGPGYVFLVCEALARAAQDLGVETSQAHRLARQTIIGSACILEHSEESPQDLYERMIKIKGTTAAAIEVLIGSKKNIFDLFKDALAVAYLKSKELSQ